MNCINLNIDNLNIFSEKKLIKIAEKLNCYKQQNKENLIIDIINKINLLKIKKKYKQNLIISHLIDNNAPAIFLTNDNSILLKIIKTNSITAIIGAYKNNILLDTYKTDLKNIVKIKHKGGNKIKIYNLSTEQIEIINNNIYSKSDKIRRLHLRQVPSSIIATQLNVKSSYVFSVLKRYKTIIKK